MTENEQFKISPEQLQRLNGIDTSLKQTVAYFGELHYQNLILKQEITAVEKALDDINSERLKINEELQQQYGTGTVNMETGEFVKD